MIAKRVLIATGIYTVYRGRRGLVKSLRSKVIALDREQAMALERILNTNLTIMTTFSDKDFIVAQKFVKRVREMSADG
jgi:hypothetical protein